MRFEKGGLILDLQGNPIPPKVVSTTLAYKTRALRSLTPAEKAFCKLASPLWPRAKVRYAPQAIFYVAPGISFRSDFVFRKYKAIVEVDGPSHRGKEEVDRWRDDLLRRLGGMETLRLQNEDCIERPCLTRVRVVDFLLSRPKGFKKLLREYRLSLAGNDYFVEKFASEGGFDVASL